MSKKLIVAFLCLAGSAFIANADGVPDSELDQFMLNIPDTPILPNGCDDRINPGWPEQRRFNRERILIDGQAVKEIEEPTTWISILSAILVLIFVLFLKDLAHRNDDKQGVDDD